MRKLLTLAAGVIAALVVAVSPAASATPVTCYGLTANDGITSPGWVSATKIAGQATITCTTNVKSISLQVCLQRVTGYSPSGSPIYRNVSCATSLKFDTNWNQRTQPYTCASFPSTNQTWRTWAKATVVAYNGLSGSDTGYDSPTYLKCK